MQSSGEGQAEVTERSGGAETCSVRGILAATERREGNSRQRLRHVQRHRSVRRQDLMGNRNLGWCDGAQ